MLFECGEFGKRGEVLTECYPCRQTCATPTKGNHVHVLSGLDGGYAEVHEGRELEEGSVSG